jgi:hypothetical protein
MRRISELDEKLLASQEELSAMDLVSRVMVNFSSLSGRLIL